MPLPLMLAQSPNAMADLCNQLGYAYMLDERTPVLAMDRRGAARGGHRFAGALGFLLVALLRPARTKKTTLLVMSRLLCEMAAANEEDVGAIVPHLVHLVCSNTACCAFLVNRVVEDVSLVLWLDV